MAILKESERLRKELGLFDVYALSTGAMFSSGFFLLPGLAAAKVGPAVVLAYLIAGILIIPAMLSKAELSTALPRAGGTYYFLDRSLGPAFGTIGGLGTFLALTLKTAFALIGIGAYASLFVELPIKPVAVALTVAFVAINILGAKETSGLQRILVVALLSALAYFLVIGFVDILAIQPRSVTSDRFDPMLPYGFGSLLTTAGFVFISYAGLTKIASVAEEVKRPERNIPLGMMLSLGSTTLVYVMGIFIMVAVLEPSELYESLTPVADAALKLTPWLPPKVTLSIIVLAAIAAFVSTGNAGVLSASRYPLAMARDRLVPDTFSRLGKFRTPVPAVVATGCLMIVFILTLDEEGIAKLASAFQLFIFMLVNLAVIVMRESRIRSYDPGYRSPLYPWMQLTGIAVCGILIVYLGWLAMLFTIGVVLICLVWYYKYARKHIVRDGAIYHWFQRLGRRQYGELDREFRSILREKGLRDDDPFNEIVARANVIEVVERETFWDVIDRAARLLSERLPASTSHLREGFLEGTRIGATPVAGGVALPHMHLAGIDQPEIVLARSQSGLIVEGAMVPGHEDKPPLIHAVFLLVSAEEDPGQHLRLLAEIANRVDADDFLKEWLEAPTVTDLKKLLLADERHVTLHLRHADATVGLVGKAIRDLTLPEHCLIAIVQRGSQTIIPQGDTVLHEGDRVTFIGDPSALVSIRVEFQEAL